MPEGTRRVRASFRTWRANPSARPAKEPVTLHTVPRALLLCVATALLAGGCGEGTVSNDDDVSQRAAEQAVERFFAAVHDRHESAACAQLPGPQRGGLARLSASRGGPRSCEGALRTLREFALARNERTLSFSHDIGFNSALPHRSKTALDVVSIAGRELGSIGLRRSGDTWRIAIVCECP